MADLPDRCSYPDGPSDVVDPVGVGDAFMGGWLHALKLYPDDKQMQLNYSLAAAALKNTIPGDFNLSTEDVSISYILAGKLGALNVI